MAAEVVGFTGPRKAPTPQDYAEMEEKALDILARVRAREFQSLFYVGVNQSDSPTMDWMVLPMANSATLLGGITLMQQELCDHIRSRPRGE